MFKQKQMKILLAIVAMNTLVFGCGKSPEERKKDEGSGPVLTPGSGRTVRTEGLPDASGISLATLGKARDGIALAGDEEENCDAAGDLGIFGIPLGSACFLTKIASNVMYGSRPDSNGDGVISCADYDTKLEDQGLIKALLCEQGVISNPGIVSLKFEENGRSNAISFQDFDATDDIAGVGTWTATGPDSGRFPANIRGWNAPVGSALKGLFGMKLSSSYAGNMELDLSDLGDPLKTSISFAAAADTSRCATEPNKTNCHWQDIKLKNREDAGVGTLSPGFHLFVMANEKQNADFVLIEGKMRYTKESADQVFGNPAEPLPAEFLAIREIYFRTVQKGTQIWGSFDLKDENGKTISSIIDGSDLPRVLRDGLAGAAYSGVCQNLGTAVFGDCRDINYHDYDTMWVGAEKFETVGADFVLKTDFSGAPTADGLVTK